MKIVFSKYHGAGNDFILIDNRNNFYPLEDRACIARLCDRRFGVGADGILCLESSSVADCKMRIFNADGSSAAMCGNGIRCVADFLQGGRDVKVEAGGCIFSCRRVGDGISVDLGAPKVMHWPIELKGMQLYVLNTGVPHAVVFVEDLVDIPFLTWGKEVRSHPAFAPEGVNVNFVRVDADNSIALRTFERGVEAETLSCGTGAAAAAWAAGHIFALQEPIAVKTAGLESLFFSFPCSCGEKKIEMHGPAKKVFSGEVDI